MLTFDFDLSWNCSILWSNVFFRALKVLKVLFTWHIEISTFSLTFLIISKLFAVVNIFNYVSVKVLQKCLLKIEFFKIICDSLGFPHFLNLISYIPDWFCKEIKSSWWSFPVFFFVGPFFDEKLFSFSSSSLILWSISKH